MGWPLMFMTHESDATYVDADMRSKKDKMMVQKTGLNSFRAISRDSKFLIPFDVVIL